MVKNPPDNAGDTGFTPELGRSLENEMATHSSILAWKIPWKEEAGGLQFMESQRVRHDLVTKQQHERELRWATPPITVFPTDPFTFVCQFFIRYTSTSANSFKLSSFIHSFLVIS